MPFARQIFLGGRVDYDSRGPASRAVRLSTSLVVWIAKTLPWVLLRSVGPRPIPVCAVTSIGACPSCALCIHGLVLGHIKLVVGLVGFPT